MINSNTSFGKLKTIIVGRELSFNKRIADISFKTFYKDAIDKLEIYEKSIDGYSIDFELLQKRNKQLDEFAQLLASFNIKVYRPKKVDKIIQFKTPYFSSQLTSANNVRDITLVYQNKIIETPIFVRGRYFENMALYDIFKNELDNNSQWIKAPNTCLTERTLDLDDWKKERDFLNIPSNYEMCIDGAQFLRIGRDVIVNVSTYNHYLGFQWIKSFYPKTNFHMISIADNHIDGIIHCLKPGVFLVDPKYKTKINEILPNKFKTWKIICPDENLLRKDNMSNMQFKIASSRGMDMNILSINENTVCVNKTAIGVKSVLENNGFNVIEVQLDNCEIFAGGLHCSTLDLIREDEYVFY